MADAKVFINTRLICLGNLVLMTDSLVVVQPEKVFQSNEIDTALQVVRSIGAPLRIETPFTAYHSTVYDVAGSFDMMLLRLKKPLQNETSMPR